MPLLDVNAEAAINGSVAVSPKQAYPGDTVEVAITPDSGYSQKAGSIKYSTASGTERLATQVDANQYTFIMPKEPVTVSAVFLSKTRSIGTAESILSLRMM